MKAPRRVLVTDGEQRSALAVVRSLGRAGHDVLVASRRGASLAGASRFARADLALGDPLADASRFAEGVERTVTDDGIDVLLPVSEASMRAILERLDHDRRRIPCGDLESFLRISDKGRVLEVAAEIGIAVPEQRVVESPDHIDRDLERDLPFPLVLKPARSVSMGGSGALVKSSVHYARDRDGLRATLRATPETSYPIFLQQRIVGPGTGVFLLLWDGRLVASFGHRRIREKPPSGGVSVYRESVALDPGLLEKARALLERFAWEGVAMVEFKVDRDSGVPYLMEINPRFWGSLQLAVDAGVDFPRLLVEAALGLDPTGPDRYRTGVRSRWWWGDVDQMIIRLRGSAGALDLPPDAPGTAAVLRDFLRLWRSGDRSEVLRFGDPRPFLRESRLWFRRS